MGSPERPPPKTSPDESLSISHSMKAMFPAISTPQKKTQRRFLLKHVRDTSGRSFNTKQLLKRVSWSKGKEVRHPPFKVGGSIRTFDS